MNYVFVPMQDDMYREIPDEARPRLCEDTQGIVALNDKGEMQAACVMDTWSHNAVQIHMWIKNAFVLRHGFAEEIANFIYGSGRELIIGVTPEDNKMALKFNKHMGMVEKFRIPDGYDKGVDYVVTVMRKEDCRWLHDEAPKQAIGG